MDYPTERERTEKPKGANKALPKDAQVIMSILKLNNIQEYDPRVINQLLEFTYRYVSCLLDDAKVYANHAKKKSIETEDVKLAAHMILERSFTGPPSTEVLLELGRQRNSIALPAVKMNCGLRLPPERHCLLSANYKLRASEVPKRMSKSAVERAAKNRSTGSNNLKRQQGGKGAKAPPTPKPVFKVANGKGNKLKTPSKSAAAAPAADEAALPAVVTVPKTEAPEEVVTMDESNVVDAPVIEQMQVDEDVVGTV